MDFSKTLVSDGYTQTSTHLHSVCGIYAKFMKKLCGTETPILASIYPYHQGNIQVVTIAVWSEHNEELGIQLCLRALGKYDFDLPNADFIDIELEHIISVHDLVEAFHFCSMLLESLNATICTFGNVHNETNPHISLPKESMPEHPFGRINLWKNATKHD